MKIGIIKEGKNPPDKRVAITPVQCKHIIEKTGLELVVESSAHRCYEDSEYLEKNVPVVSDISDCDVLLGVKEVPIESLISNKTYFFFSHTIKAQSYNRSLLQAILSKQIRLIDWETLTDDKGQRLIAFGKFAGMVGAHNGLFTYGKRTGTFDLKRLKDCKDYEEAKALYKEIKWPAVSIVLTGNGRVANGSAMVLDDMGIKRLSAFDFLNYKGAEAVYTQIGIQDYARHKENPTFSNEEFYKHPERFVSNFKAYQEKADLFINGIYWDNNAPAFFSNEDMQSPSFRIKVIADITCDIAPVSSVPSTIRPSTIEQPIYGYDPDTGNEVTAHQPDCIDVMAIDNLPNELPRDASQAFGEQFINQILPELMKPEVSDILQRATIARHGRLCSNFEYLQAFVDIT